MSGKHLAIAMAAMFILVVGVMSIVKNASTDNGEDYVTIEMVIEAYKANDNARMQELADKVDMTVEDLKRIAAEHIKREEREKTLGSWEDAVNSGLMIAEDAPDEDGDIARYYDVDGDNIIDFQVYFRDGKPFVWRYADEEGKPYG